MKVKFSRRFSKQYDKSPNKVKKAFDERITLFIKDKLHPLLNNHAFSGNLKITEV